VIISPALQRGEHGTQLFEEFRRDDAASEQFYFQTRQFRFLFPYHNRFRMSSPRIRPVNTISCGRLNFLLY
jgi:hypothetical protein